MLLNKDYRGVKYLVWTLLKRIYGSHTQEVVRDTLDIYAEDKIEEYRYLCIIKNKPKDEEEEKEGADKNTLALARRGTSILLGKQDSNLKNIKESKELIRSSSLSNVK